MFSGRGLLIATIHGKEKVLSPLLEAQLGVTCFLPCAEFNSDEFGTFTGEVERKNAPLTALRKKCLGIYCNPIQYRTPLPALFSANTLCKKY